MHALFVTLARYSQWAGARLETELAKLTPAQRNASSAANFGSILAIANHLVLADRLWLNRFTGQGQPVERLDAAPYAELAELGLARRVEEDRCLAYLLTLDPARLHGTLRYATTNGARQVQPLALCLTQFFNHQAHHRGQMHGMMGAFGITAADIDFIAYVREAAAD